MHKQPDNSFPLQISFIKAILIMRTVTTFIKICRYNIICW